jgi:tetratricopeptide (TPR) repeat protein
MAEPQTADAWRERATHHEERGDPKAAVTAYRHVLALEPDDHASRFQAAQLLVFQLERPADALALLDEAAAYGDANLEYHRGIALDFLGKKAEAAATYERAFALSAGTADHWVQPGEMLAEASIMHDGLGQPGRADTLARQAIAVDPLVGRSWEAFGYAANRRGAFDVAAGALAICAALDPSKAAFFAGDGELAELRRDPARRRLLAPRPLGNADKERLRSLAREPVEDFLTALRGEGLP